MKKKERQDIFEKYGGKCAYCGCELLKGWHVDHIEPVVRDSKWNKGKGRFQQTGTLRNPENDNLENYNPSCASCNIQKNSYTLEQFRRNIKQFVDSLNLYSTQYKFAKKYGLIEETKSEVVFYFEKNDNGKEDI
jgi:5-methylcytosine-specific restriction endonuclease McrA